MDNTREKLIDIIFNSLFHHIHKSCRLSENIADDLIANDVAMVVHAKWEWKSVDGTEWLMLCCSNCEETGGAHENYDYCPNCGAKMDK